MSKRQDQDRQDQDREVSDEDSVTEGSSEPIRLEEAKPVTIKTAHGSFQVNVVVQRNKPDSPGGLISLAKLHMARGDDKASVGFLERALSLDPDNPDAHRHLGLARARLGNLPEAEAHLRWSLALASGNHAARCDLGNVLLEQDKVDKALETFQTVVTLRPDLVAGQRGVAACWRRLGRPGEAVAPLHRALKQKPKDPVTIRQFARLMGELGNHREAETLWRQLIELRPKSVEAAIGLAETLAHLGRHQEVIEACRNALALKGHVGGAGALLARTELRLGHYLPGWRHLTRWRAADPEQPEVPADVAAPWSTTPASGKRLLLLPERSLALTLMLLRYLPHVQAHGGRTVMALPPSLIRLVTASDIAETVVASGTDSPSHDLFAPLAELPMRFASELANLPRNIPYLRPPEDARRAWQARLADDPGIKIGLALHDSEPTTGAPPSPLDPSMLEFLSQLPGVTLYNLQAESRQQTQLVFGSALQDPSPNLTDLAETAALMTQLDLVISADSVCTHLAGACGCRVWGLLPAMAHWCWLLERDDSPWYPDLRLFRRRRDKGWEEVVARLEHALEELLFPPQQATLPAPSPTLDEAALRQHLTPPEPDES